MANFSIKSCIYLSLSSIFLLVFVSRMNRVTYTNIKYKENLHELEELIKNEVSSVKNQELNHNEENIRIPTPENGSDVMDYEELKKGKSDFKRRKNGKQQNEIRKKERNAKNKELKKLKGRKKKVFSRKRNRNLNEADLVASAQMLSSSKKYSVVENMDKSPREFLRTVFAVEF